MLKHFCLIGDGSITRMTSFPKTASADWLRKLYPSQCKDEKKVVAVAKSNEGTEELRLRYVRFYLKVNKVNKSCDHRSSDLSITKCEI